MEIAKAQALWALTRMDRPIGSLLLLWPTLWALFLAADGWPDIDVALVFILGVVLMRSAGCVINDFADRHVDGHVKRTCQRPLPSGRVTEKEALAVFIVLALTAFFLVLTMNRLTVQLSFVGIALASIYPFMKRYTHFPQVILGMAFGWSIPMAFAAQLGYIPLQAWLLFVANVLWTVAYDTQYAMVDRDDDIKIGVKSTAVLFGRYDKRMVAILQLLALGGLVWLGYWSNMNVPFYVGLLAASALFVYQQYLMKHRQRDKCFQAFLNNNYVGMVVFIGVLLSIVL
ncbi:4-hydroxybenzoate octaprenyltransferase [Thaumasiovibrio sp. DFM-14]|uniref:4-hydroxybenzoate octaprenyltransferase n=1 Tax=Thaumasiovibrio sp. DFM-14 TaxID=3384792 RepID=UPI0039A0A16E